MHPQLLTGQPGMGQGQPRLQPPAMQRVHSNEATQNTDATQVGVQRAGLAQQQLQVPMGGMSP